MSHNINPVFLLGHSKEKTKLPFETILLSSLEKLSRYLDTKQLPPEMGGTLPYDHSEWIKLRLQLEHLIASHNFILDHFSRLERQITHEDNPRYSVILALSLRINSISDV